MTRAISPIEVNGSELVVVSRAASPMLVEQFRSLAAMLHTAQAERPLRSLVVTSASPGDGKSHVAVNLALTLSDSYRRTVLLIDADLRHPLVHTFFGVSNGGGLSEALKMKAGCQITPVQISETLSLLCAGQPEPNPLVQLSSGRMGEILEDCKRSYDWVIVDSPPVGLLADGRLVAEMVDAAILVVRAGITPFPALQAAADAIGRQRIFGLVLNAVDPSEIRGKDYYHKLLRT